MNNEIVLCYTETVDSKSNVYKYLEDLDSKGYEVHLFSNTITNHVFPHVILNNLDQIYEIDKEYIFLSDIEELFGLVYRVYHQTFAKFIYFQQNKHDFISIEYINDPIYSYLSKYCDLQEEHLNKPIYTNIDKDSMVFIEYKKFPLTDLYEQANINDMDSYIQKYYWIDDKFYVFEPKPSNDRIIFGANCNITPSITNTEYIFNYSSDLIIKTYEHLQKCKVGADSYELERNGHNIENQIRSLTKYNFTFIIRILEDFECLYDDSLIFQAIYLLSMLAEITKKPTYLEQILKKSITSSLLTVENKYYIYQQIKSFGFYQPLEGINYIDELKTDLYRNIYKAYYDKLSDTLKPIPLKERNKDIVIIFTYQFLENTHPPTHTTLERAYDLQKSMGKKVIIINTRENITTSGICPFYNLLIGNCKLDLSERSEVVFRDETFDFYQPVKPMPDYNEIKYLIELVKKLKPYLILNIGCSSIVADICGNLVPEISIPVVGSSLPMTMSKFSVWGRKVREEEWEDLYKKGYDKDSIIESTFTFDAKPDNISKSRDELNLPKDKFLMLIVGNRLDYDITDEYIKCVKETFDMGTHLVIAGDFDKYEEFCEKYEGLSENSTCLGRVNSINPIYKNCDLYVNSKRVGGGTSLAEAFYNGLPCVTIDFGDIAVATGEDFWVKDYDEMKEVIRKYVTDSNFYNIMREKAIKRADDLTNSAKALKEIISKAEKSKYFF
ncbi:glycosyltransferase [Anaeromicropila herbilytica]|uniref:Flavodoxin n=1 Tax=Anaeromicropila herbilytica TaxID=2785025 RepID=A0A7R7EPV8_9FIRM|nr:glycosyltransferase [Anaeromicropila herbilytica]BCN32540.1 flavodoxin [Anaeromicropila herbilytica]